MKILHNNPVKGVLLVGAFIFSLTGLLIAATAVNLGTANNFVILAGTAITNTGTSAITGDVGLSPASGGNYGAGVTAGQVTGTIYAVDDVGPAGSTNNAALLVNAKNDLTTAYDDAAGQALVSTIASELGGTTKTAGVYNTADGELGINGTLTLDAQGDANAVFIFKSASTLTTNVSSAVILANGAQACNIFWQVGSSATLGVNSVFKGNILALTSVSLATGANVEGRILARNGAVTMESNTITKPICAIASVPDSGYNNLTVVNQVINDGGDTATYADFQLFVNGTAINSGQTRLLPAGNYVITENNIQSEYAGRYTTTFGGDCDAQGRVVLSGVGGYNKTCLVINNDNKLLTQPLALAPVPPLIDLVKVPRPLALPAGPGLVEYTYTLRNIGSVPVGNIELVGDTCGPIILSGGDNNGDSRLDVNEVWTYRCSTTLAETHTNTVVVIGRANGLYATDIASATVVVGAPVVPPLIHVVKKSNALVMQVNGSAVFTYVVDNPGIVALNNVRVADDRCSAVKYVSGDLNRNNLLESSEKWSYSCQMKLTQTTTNTATASGAANGLTARDFAIVTVVVVTPELPNAGIKDTTPRNIAILAGLLALTAGSLAAWKTRAA